MEVATEKTASLEVTEDQARLLASALRLMNQANRLHGQPSSVALQELCGAVEYILGVEFGGGEACIDMTRA